MTEYVITYQLSPEMLNRAMMSSAKPLRKRRMNWLCFDGIDRITDATVLRAGGVVYAVPDAALPDDVTPEAFRADLTTWMEAAR